MGLLFGLFFGDDDAQICKDIAKLHDLPIELVEEAYKEMLKSLKEEKGE